MNLRLLQLGDSALPIGGYSHSWGLEAGIEHGLVRDASGLEAWTRLYMRHVLAPLEGVVVSAVGRALPQKSEQELIRANGILWAGLSPPTLRQASRDMGEQLLSLAGAWPWASEVVAALRAHHAERWHHAVVFGCLAAGAEARALEALSLYLHQAALGVISAGVRAVPIGHTHGQQILARLHQDIAELAESFHDKALASAGSSCPAYEILCHDQSQLYTRIFRS